MDDVIQSAVAGLSRKIDDAQRNWSQLTRTIRDLPDLFSSVAQEQPDDRSCQIIALVEDNVAQLRESGILDEVTHLLEVLLIRLPYLASDRSQVSIERFVSLFEATLRSDMLSEAAFSWLHFAEGTTEWRTCLAYCEIVARALRNTRLWEITTTGEMRRDRAKRVFGILTRKSLWADKLEILERSLEGHRERRGLLGLYSRGALAEPPFAEARAYIWREGPAEGFSSADRDALLDEMRKASAEFNSDNEQ